MFLPDWLKPRGRIAELSRQTGLPGSFLSRVKAGEKQIPAERCPTIERITDRQVTCEEMRPDVEWHVLRTADAVPIRNGGVDAAGGSTVVVLASPAPANDSAPDVPAPERA